MSTITQRNDALKMIALITMFIDHLGLMFFPELFWMRTIGRIAFPIFAYQLALGFKYTRSRSNYAFRLLTFAIVAQLPYSFFNASLSFTPYSLNIMFTLLYALMMLTLLNSTKTLFQNTKKERTLSLFILSFIQAISLIFLLILPEMIAYLTPFHMEYGSTGVCFVILFYALSQRPVLLTIGYISLSLLGTYYALTKSSYYAAPQLYTPLTALFDYKNAIRIANLSDTHFLNLSGRLFQARSIMALPIIFLMEKWSSLVQNHFRLNQYVAYWFYPAHIAILIFIKYGLEALVYYFLRM